MKKFTEWMESLDPQQYIQKYTQIVDEANKSVNQLNLSPKIQENIINSLNDAKDYLQKYGPTANDEPTDARGYADRWPLNQMAHGILTQARNNIILKIGEKYGQFWHPELPKLLQTKAQFFINRPDVQEIHQIVRGFFESLLTKIKNM